MAEPQSRGAADGYYTQNNQPPQQQYAPNGQQQYAPNVQQQYEGGPPQQQQYQQQEMQAPPQYGKQAEYGMGEKQDFHQTFKIEHPKWNDLWAAVLFIICFGGFVAVSALSIKGYNNTNQGGGIYNGANANSVTLNSNTIILFAFVLGVSFVLSLAYFTIIRVCTKQ